jgi:hypothetical protein
LNAVRGASTMVVALGLAGCGGPGLHLTIDVLPSELPLVDEVRIRIDQKSGPPLGLDLGGADLGPIRESGAEVAPGVGNTVITFARGSFRLASQFETVLLPSPPGDVDVSLAGGLFQSDGAWLGGGAMLPNLTLSSERATSAQLSLQCDQGGCFPPVGVIDLATPPASPAIVVARGAFDPTRLLAIAPLGPPNGGDTLLVGDSSSVRLYRPATFSSGPTLPAALSSTAIIIGKQGEPLGTAAAVGDLDGDGQPDLALSSPVGLGGAGEVFIFYSQMVPSSGPLDLNTDLVYAAIPRVVGQQAEALGTALAILPGPSGNLLVIAAAGSGRVYVVAPPKSGVASIATANATLTGASATAVLAVGALDVGGATLAVGVPSSNAVHLLPAAELSVPVTIDLASGPTTTLSGTGSFGASLAIGLFNTTPTLAVGAPDADTVSVYQGGLVAQWSAPVWTLNGTPATRFGASLAMTRTFGPDVLAVGATAASPFGKLAGGEVVVFDTNRLGDPSLVSTVDVSQAALLLWSESDGDGLGAQAAFGRFDTSSGSDQLFVGKTSSQGAVYGIADMSLP